MEIIRRLELTFQYIQSFAYSFLLLGYLLFVPIQSQILNNIVTCLALVVICISFIKSRMVYKFIAISFLIIGVLLAVYDRKFNILFVSGRFVEGIHIVLPVLALFTIVPLFAYPVQAGSYHHSIAQIVYSVKKSKISSRFYYLLTIFTTYLLTIMMNIASIATTKNSLLGLQKTFDQNVQQHILMRALPRGFILATIWSPVSVVGITAVTGTGGDWLIYVQVAVVLSLILVLITALLGWKEVPFSAASMFVVVESEGDKRNDRSP